jgi:DNA-binding MarR family transcriptional regulator
MMFALFGQRQKRLVVRQKRLCQILGVTTPTVSRMSRSLETLGLLTRTRSTIDRRQVVIELTKAGFRLFKRVYKFCTTRGWSHLAMCTGVGGHPEGNRWFDAAYCHPRLDTLEGLLDGIRVEFRDFGTLDYPGWGPPATSAARATSGA